MLMIICEIPLTKTSKTFHFIYAVLSCVFLFQTQWASGSLGLSGLCVQWAAVEDSSPALVSAALHHAAASIARARPATPKSASVSPCFL